MNSSASCSFKTDAFHSMQVTVLNWDLLQKSIKKEKWPSMATLGRRELFLLPMEGICGERMMKAIQTSQKALAI